MIKFIISILWIIHSIESSYQKYIYLIKNWTYYHLLSVLKQNIIDNLYSVN